MKDLFDERRSGEEERGSSLSSSLSSSAFPVAELPAHLVPRIFGGCSLEDRRSLLLAHRMFETCCSGCTTYAWSGGVEGWPSIWYVPRPHYPCYGWDRKADALLRRMPRLSDLELRLHVYSYQDVRADVERLLARSAGLRLRLHCAVRDACDVARLRDTLRPDAAAAARMTVALRIRDRPVRALVEALAPLAPQLTGLDLEGCWEAADLVALAALASGSRPPPPQPLMSPPSSSSPASSASSSSSSAPLCFPALRSLCLSRCHSWVNVAALAALAGGELRRLDLRHNHGVQSLAPLSRLTALESLDVAGCLVSSLAPLAALAASLRRLDVSGCVNAAAVAVDASVQALRALTGLESLDVSWCDAFVPAAAAMPGLRRLSLKQCCGLRDLTPLAGLRGLEFVDLQGCCGVTDLTPLASLRRLQVVDLQGCRGVTDLTPLAASLGALRTLVVERAHDVAPLWGAGSLPRPLKRTDSCSGGTCRYELAG
jgi:hypothetical protein